MSTWHTIYQGGVDDPVRANPDAFYSESSNAANTATTIQYVSDEFSKIRYGRSDGFRGATADAFADKARDWQTKLEPTARVFTDVSNILYSHAGRLSRLRSEATVAAGKALAVWKLRNAAQQLASSAASGVSTAQGEVAHAQKQLTWIRSQIAALPPADPTTAIVLPKYQAQETSWQQELADRSNRLRRQKSDLASAHADEKTYNDQLTDWYNGSRNNSWQSLRNREDELNSDTVKRIKGIDLRGVEDPGWWKEHLSDFAGWIKNAATAIKNAIEAAITALVKALKLVLQIAAKVLLALVIIAAIVAVIFIVAIAMAFVVLYVLPALLALVTKVTAALLIVAVGRYLFDYIRSPFGAAHDWAETLMMAFTDSRKVRNAYLPPGSVASAVRDCIAGDPAGTDYDALYKYKWFANDSYARTNADNANEGCPNGFSIVSSDELEARGIDSRWLDNSINGFSATVYRNPDTDEVIVAFRGTEPKDGRDWTNDIADGVFGGGLPASQEAQARLLAGVIAGGYGAENIVFTGHSLGGDLAAQAAMVTGGVAVTFNAKAVKLSDLGLDQTSRSALDDAKSRIVNIRVDGEPLHRVNEITPDALEIGTNITFMPANPGDPGFENVKFHDLNQIPEPGKQILAGCDAPIADGVRP